MSTKPNADNLPVQDLVNNKTVTIPHVAFKFQKGTPPFGCDYITHVVLGADLKEVKREIEKIGTVPVDAGIVKIFNSSRAGLAEIIDLTKQIGSGTKFAFISSVDASVTPNLPKKLALSRDPEGLGPGLFLLYATTLVECILEHGIFPQVRRSLSDEEKE